MARRQRHQRKKRSDQSRSKTRSKKSQQKSQKTFSSRSSNQSSGGKSDQPSVAKLRGRIQKNKKGFGFVSLEGESARDFEDIYLPKEEASRFLHGDRVEVSLDQRDEITGFKITARRFEMILGRFEPAYSRPKAGWLIYDRKNGYEKIFVPEQEGQKARPGDWILGRLQFHDRGPHPISAKIEKVYGDEFPAAEDIDIIAGEFGLKEGHSAKSVQSAKAFTPPRANQLDPGRVDLRDLPLVTIDGEDARDFDDAVYVEKRKDGFTLWVAIADVSHYVKRGDSIDEEAYERGTSVYFPERAFHMLPSELSEGLCSLRPDEDRLALVARIDLSSSGAVKKTEPLTALIRSHRRWTYEELFQASEKEKKNKTWAFHPHFELFELLRKRRLKRGAIDFELPEAKVQFGKEPGVPTDIKTLERRSTHRMIEEFMIIANEAITEWVDQHGWPFIYRVHEEPSPEGFERFQELAKSLGMPFRGSSMTAKAISEFLAGAKGKPSEHLLNMTLLRTLKQANYGAENRRHFGLASPGYTHFTSPIRRYPDLIVHRVVKDILNVAKKHSKKPTAKDQTDLEKSLIEASTHCSHRERVAAEAEREAVKLKQVRLMRQNLGNTFQGIVNGMNAKAMYVQIQTPFVEGSVPLHTLPGDRFDFDQDRMILVGKRTRKQFKVGDTVSVQVIKADIDRRQIDLELVSQTGKKVST